MSRERVRRDSTILSVASQMSNILFNLKQRRQPALLTKEEQEQFAELQSKWDSALAIYRHSFKCKREGRP